MSAPVEHSIDHSSRRTDPALPREVRRFDVHQLIQHMMIAVSFVLLVLTGWPLSTKGVGVSHVLVRLFGGLEICGVVHKVAGVVMLAAAAYHLVYLAVLALSRRFRWSMVPTWKDLRDFGRNLLYFFGRRRERPRFARYTYFEKFDYWAVFWGITIMGGSGLIRWFPVEATKIFPPWIYEVAHYAHADEALLAALAIFIWHFYNVHLRPGIFPMSRVFIDGKLTLEQLEHEHGAEYDELVARAEREAGVDEGAPGASAERDEGERS